jgi:hypothetical protein
MTRRQFLFKRSFDCYTTFTCHPSGLFHTSSILGIKFTLEQWPAHYDEARQVILDLQTTNTHKLHPIAAYDIHGVPIKPLQYHTILEGALVRMDFSVNYWQARTENLCS